MRLHPGTTSDHRRPNTMHNGSHRRTTPRLVATDYGHNNHLFIFSLFFALSRSASVSFSPLDKTKRKKINTQPALGVVRPGPAKHPTYAQDGRHGEGERRLGCRLTRFSRRHFVVRGICLGRPRPTHDVVLRRRDRWFAKVCLASFLD